MALEIYEREDNDPATVSRAAKLRDAAQEFGVQATAGVLAEFVKRVMGGW